MRGLTILVTRAEPGRLPTVLTIAAASAALGGTARVYFHEDAVRLLADADLSLATDSGVALIACQTGLAAAGLDLSALDPAIEAGGLVSLLATLGDDRLVSF